MLRTLTTTALASFAATAAHADLLVDIQDVDNSSVPSLSSFVTQDLVVTSDADWTAAALLLELDNGTIFQQEAFGSTTEAPNRALFAVSADVEFDTYLQAKDGAAVSIAGQAGDVGGDAEQFDASEIDISWFNTATDDIGSFPIARLTLSDDAAGQWAMKLTSAGQPSVTTSGTITDGAVVIPEPTSAALLGLALLGLGVRRRS